MDIKEAVQSARQILDDERTSPTTDYAPSPPNSQKDVPTTIAAMAGYLNMHNVRAQHPRKVLEDPTLFEFKSVNHNLLRGLLSQVPLADRPNFTGYMRLCLAWGVGAAKTNGAAYPKWNSLTSEAPLVVEFLVRNGSNAELIQTLQNDKIKIIPGHILLLLELEDPRI